MRSNATMRQPSVEQVCPHCGNPFRTSMRRMLLGKGKFCSRACASTHRRESQPVESRLWLKVSQQGPIPKHRAEYGPCWPWTGQINGQGYGRIYRHFPDAVLTHRLAWEIATGETLTTDDVIGHVCDIRHCVRNDDEGSYEVGDIRLPRRGHLFKGTHIDNQADMVAKNRHRPYVFPILRGSAAPWAKLTEDDIREIRHRYAAGGVTQTALGLEFGVHNVTISEIVLRKKWQHVD
jgi:hypothetical protein